MSGNTALHAIRLTLRLSQHTPNRHASRCRFSTAVLPYPPIPTASINTPSSRSQSSFSSSSSSSSSSRSAWAPPTPRHAASDYDGSSDFLDAEAVAEEYHTAETALPPLKSPTPLTWPKLFTLPSLATPPDSRARRCDTLARLVEIGDLTTARTVYNELRALGVAVDHRKVYLTAAMAVLDHTAAGKNEFMFWLELVPNRPAIRPYPPIKAVWQPLVDRLRDEFTADTELIAGFLRWAARKGVLPLVLSPLMRLLCHTVRPEETARLMDELMRAYMAATTSRHSRSKRAEVHRWFAGQRRADMWNAYIRGLAAAGWDRYAVEYVRRVGGVEWTEYTLAMVARKVRASATVEASPRIVEPITPSMDLPRGVSQDVPSLVDEVRRAKTQSPTPGLQPISPSSLRDLIFRLEHAGRVSLVERLERRFAASTSTASAGFRYETWLHARLLLVWDRDGSDLDMLRFFEAHFYWLGIPPHPLHDPSASRPTPTLMPQEQDDVGDSTSATSAGNWLEPVPTPDIPMPRPLGLRKLYPSAGVIATLLPHLLALLPPPLSTSIPQFHAAYLDLVTSSALAPRLRLSRKSQTAHAMIRPIVHHLGPTAGMDAIARMVQRGIRPGAEAYAAVLYGLAGRAMWGRLSRLVGCMEAGVGFGEAYARYLGAGAHQVGEQAQGRLEGGAEFRLPRPEVKAYLNIAGILEGSGQVERAEIIRAKVGAGLVGGNHAHAPSSSHLSVNTAEDVLGDFERLSAHA